MTDVTVACRLLDWYGVAAREMPWRVGPAARAAGKRPDPYRVWLSEIMLQQTTVAAVRDYFMRFTMRWPDVFTLAAAKDDDVMAEWAGLGYYARARNLLKCARVVAADGGTFPETEAALQKLPGIGPYTAAAIAAIAFDRRAVVVDGNVERVMARYHAVITPLPDAKPVLRDHAATHTPDHRPGDYAQGVMDLGATICTPRNPACEICPVMSDCAGRKSGIAAELPRRVPKAQKPLRRGHVYVLRDIAGGIFLKRRPETGLLGGMMGFPGSDWSDAPEPAPPCAADWVAAPDPVIHVFTHFRLELTVYAAILDADNDMTFTPATQFDDRSLPSVMRKVFRAGQAVLQDRAA